MDVLRFTVGSDAVRIAVGRIEQAIIASQRRGKVTIGLSGGSTPGPVYSALAQSRQIDWKNVTVFLVDERFVPPGHPDSNQRLIRETLLSGPAAVAAAVFPDTSLTIEACVMAYEAALKPVRPDILILGMGEDGHIASLFPPLSPGMIGPKRVILTTTDRFAVQDRITVTLDVLQAAKEKFFLINGTAKWELLKAMQKTPTQVTHYPAQALFGKKTTWIVGP
jgi:6-phosphogluconolactonase